jgi:hypothetical protein
MKPAQEIPRIVKNFATSVADVLHQQVNQLMQLVTKQPKKPPLSWDSIIGDGLSGKAKNSATVVIHPTVAPELPEVHQKLAQLPPEIFDELFRRIQMNIVDEVQAIRLFEKLFICEIQILRGHVHFYKCTNEKNQETIDYTTLTGRLLQLFTEHKQLVRASATHYHP